MIKTPVISYKAVTKVEGQDEVTIDLIRTLNEGYGRAYLTSDAAWYDQMLAENFQCIKSNGVLMDKAEFLKEAALPVAMEDFRFEEVEIRLFGDVAIIHALNPYKAADGSTGTTRYTDIWVRKDGDWKAISAHITPIRSAS